MFYRLSEMVNELNSTNSKNEKMEILDRYPDLMNVLEYTYNPYKKYGVKSSQLKKKRDIVSGGDQYDNLFQILDDLADRKLTGHEAIATLNAIIKINILTISIIDISFNKTNAYSLSSIKA